jgi:hypothetical protein
MIWPANLVSATVFNTLHGHATAGDSARGGISRERFFFYVFCVYFVWSESFPYCVSASTLIFTRRLCSNVYLHRLEVRPARAATRYRLGKFGSGFAWATWIRPNDVKLNQVSNRSYSSLAPHYDQYQLFGTTHGQQSVVKSLSSLSADESTGLAFGLVTLDWAQISYIGSPYVGAISLR